MTASETFLIVVLFAAYCALHLLVWAVLVVGAEADGEGE